MCGLFSAWFGGEARRGRRHGFQHFFLFASVTGPKSVTRGAVCRFTESQLRCGSTPRLMRLFRLVPTPDRR